MTICAACDKDGGIARGTYHATHTLLYVTEGSHSSSSSIRVIPPPIVVQAGDPAQPAPTVILPGNEASEKKLQAMEERLTGMEKRFEAVKDGLGQVQNALEIVVSLLRGVPPSV